MKAFVPRCLNAGSSVQTASARSAMGYPESFLRGRFDDVSIEIEKVRGKTAQDLTSLVESKEIPLKERYAAGLLLSLIGDPRIQVLNPTLIEIREAKVTIGLEADEVERVTKELQECGVLSEWIQKEAPCVCVEIAAFSIAKYPVTNAEYKIFLEETGHPEIPSSWLFGKYPTDRGNHPVYSVSSRAADAYANWLERKTGRAFRLPTENEWEYAAAGISRQEYPWGANFHRAMANTVEENILSTTPVGMFVEGNSFFGLADMAGNVEEYVSDDYRPYGDYASPPDDLEKIHGSYRVARGGSFTRFHDLARCKRRHGWYPKDIYVMGFRLALSQEIR